jgi:predicted transcriptional regulator
MTDALISIRPTYVREIVSGSKAVEIRRRRLNIPVGTRLWIYSTRPEACVSVVARVQATETGSPLEMWPRIVAIAGISEGEFARYCSGIAVVTVIFLEAVEELETALDLTAIRIVSPNFHPPQFYSRLSNASNLVELFVGNLRNENNYE